MVSFPFTFTLSVITDLYRFIGMMLFETLDEVLHFYSGESLTINCVYFVVGLVGRSLFGGKDLKFFFTIIIMSVEINFIFPYIHLLLSIHSAVQYNRPQ